MKVYVVCIGNGYYANSVWTTREAAIVEAKRLDEWDDEDPLRFVQEWEVNVPDQHWAEDIRVNDR
jgi:hypothetical protein